MKWNFTEFKTYVLLEAAHGDMDFSDEEKEIIMKALEPETYRKMYDEFSSDTDYERIEKIRQAAKVHCDTDNKKLALMEKVKTLFDADGEYSTMEHNLMMYLKKLI